MADRRRHAPLDNPGLFVKAHIRYDFRYFNVSYGVRPRDQQAVTAVNDGFRDEGNLLGGLALAKHNLRKALSGRAVVVDPRESQVFERPIGRCQIFGAACRVGRIEPSFPHRVKQRSERVEGGNLARIRRRHRYTFDSARGAYLKLRIVPRRRFLIL